MRKEKLADAEEKGVRMLKREWFQGEAEGESQAAISAEREQDRSDRSWTKGPRSVWEEKPGAGKFPNW